MSSPQPIALADDAGTAEETRFGLSSLLWANAMPLWHRLTLGEGLLLAVNMSIVIASGPSLGTLAAQALVSTGVLIALYLLNDVIDAHRDLLDPTKDQRFVRFCVRHRPRLALVLAVEHVALVALAYGLLGARSAIATAAVLGVNLAYSLGLKGRAAIDVPWVATWGALYAMVTGIALPFTMFAIVGLMTSIAHVFQITRDREVDTRNHVRTSAVALPWLPKAQMALGSLGMGLCAGQLLGVVAGLTAIVPFVLYVTLRSNQTAWLLAKAYYGVLWLVLLSIVHVA